MRWLPERRGSAARVDETSGRVSMVFWPTRASSCHQISIAVLTGSLRSDLPATRAGRRSFFKTSSTANSFEAPCGVARADRLAKHQLPWQDHGPPSSHQPNMRTLFEWARRAPRVLSGAPRPATPNGSPDIGRRDLSREASESACRCLVIELVRHRRHACRTSCEINADVDPGALGGAETENPVTVGTWTPDSYRSATTSPSVATATIVNLSQRS